MVRGLPRPKLCSVQVSLDCRLLEYLKEETALFFLFLLDYASRTCSLPRQDIFCTLSFVESGRILSRFSNLSAILKHRGKNFAMMMSIVHLSSNRSLARTNQNARITWVIIRYKFDILVFSREKLAAQNLGGGGVWGENRLKKDAHRNFFSRHARGTTR